MGWRDGRRIARRVTLRRLGGNHHPPNAGVVFYHLEGKAGKRARYAASEPNTFLKQHCLRLVLPSANAWSLGLTHEHVSKINISRSNHSGDVAFPGDSESHPNHWETHRRSRQLCGQETK